MRSIDNADVEALARLSLVTRALTSELSPTELIDIVVRQEMAELDADGGVFALLDDAAGLTALSTFGSATAAVDGIGRLSIDRDLPLVVAARERVPVWISTRADGEARFPELARLAPASQAWAAVPLIANGTAIGALGISFLTPRSFSEAERLFIRTLADVAALAVAAHPTWLARTVGAGERDRAEIALLDLDGVVVWTNEAWTEFARANGGDVDRCGVGRSYLDVCDRAPDEPDAAAAAAAIREVLAHDGPAVTIVRFRCDSPTEQRQCALLISARHQDGRRVGATVMITRAHDEVADLLTPIVDIVRATERELDEQRRTNERLERALDRKVVIEQAKGMLASERGITVGHAFEQLRRHARRARVPLHEVADAVVSMSLRPPFDDAKPGATRHHADAAQTDLALGAISDLSRVALAVAPLIDTGPLGQFAQEVVGVTDQLMVDIRNAATGRRPTIGETFERAERSMSELGARLEHLSTNDDIGEPAAAALVEAARRAAVAASTLSTWRSDDDVAEPGDERQERLGLFRAVPSPVPTDG